MRKYIDADRLEKDGWSMHRIRQASPTEMIYETKKPTDFPAADVQEVKHGHWEFIGGYGYQYRCSVCVTCAERKTKFCSNCGARMDGDIE